FLEIKICNLYIIVVLRYLMKQAMILGLDVVPMHHGNSIEYFSMTTRPILARQVAQP
ncbi:hypothetical protein ACJX0J_025802, partial [Zea mays]